MSTNKLSSSGLRQTYQRRKILEFLESTKSHPTADAIYKEMVKEMPNVSKTTIYNTVNKLADEGIIKCIKVNDCDMRFDAFTDHHYHFVCNECGNVYDVCACCDNVLKNYIEGHQVEDVFVCYSGVCKACKSGNKKG